MIKLMDNLEIQLAKGDILIYKDIKKDIPVLKYVDDPDNINLYNCIEILSFSLQKHFVSPYPYYWEERKY